MISVGVRGEPAKAGTILGAGPGLAQDLLFVEVQMDAAGRAIVNCTHHAQRNLRNQRANIELPLDPGLETQDIFRSAGMLHVIEGASIGNGGNQGP